MHRYEETQLRILIGENNSDLAITLQLLLDAEPNMHCVATVSSGADVLSALDKHSPNAFILDLSLDDGSSMPIIRNVRERIPTAAIVVFTGHKNDLLNDQCIRAGANSVVVKSGEFELLAAALRKAAGDSCRSQLGMRADG